MFTQPNSKTPFSRLRFDVESLVSPRGRGGRRVESMDATSTARDELRFGLPADPLMDEVLQGAAPMPAGMIDRLHQLVDELPEDTAA